MLVRRRMYATAAVAALAGAGVLGLTTGTAQAATGVQVAFPAIGTAVITGTVAQPLHLALFRPTDPTCHGTAYVGTCRVQTLVGDVAIPAGTYDGSAATSTFTVSPGIACGPYQQDVYAGPRRTTSDFPQEDLLRGDLNNPALLVPCGVPTSSAPTSSAPTSTAPTDTSSAPTSSAPPTSVTSAPTSSGVDATSTTAGGTSSVDALVLVAGTGGPGQGYAAGSGYGSNLADTGAEHLPVLVTTGGLALVAGAGALVVARRRPGRSH